MAILSTLKNNKLLNICVYILKFISRASKRTLVRMFWICVSSRLAFRVLVWFVNYLIESDGIHESDDDQISNYTMGAVQSKDGYSDSTLSTNLEHEQSDASLLIQRREEEEHLEGLDHEAKRRRDALLKQLWAERQRELDDLEEFRRRIEEEYNICKNWIRLRHELPTVLKRDPKDPKAAIAEARRSLESGLRKQRRILSDLACDIARQIYRATEGQRDVMEENLAEEELVEEKALRFLSQLEKVRFQIYIDERKQAKKIFDSRQDSAIDVGYDESHEVGPAVVEGCESHENER